MLKRNPFTIGNMSPSPDQAEDTSIRFSLGLGVFMLGQALQNGNGGFTLPAILLLTVSLICLGHTLKTRAKLFTMNVNNFFVLILVFGLVWQIYQLFSSLPGVYLLPASIAAIWPFKLGIVIAGAFALLSLVPKRWVGQVWQNIFFILTLVAMWFAGVWVIKASPEPFIDTYVFQQTSGEALLQGQNPYELKPPNIYGHMGFYGEELVENGRMTIGNPYPPLSIYVSTFGYFFGGDIRYSHLMTIMLSAALIAFLFPGRGAKLAACLFVFTPRVFFVVEQSWTEPIVVFFLVASVYCAIHHPRWLPVMAGLLFASKQYLLFVLPLTLMLIKPILSRQAWINFYSVMMGVMIIVTAPLALWNFQEFLWNVGLAQWYQVFRLDALSYLAMYARAFSHTPSQMIGFIALALSFIIVWRFAPRTPSGFTISLAWCLGIFFAFNKQAFCNYYFLVIGTMCCALAFPSGFDQEIVGLPQPPGLGRD